MKKLRINVIFQKGAGSIFVCNFIFYMLCDYSDICQPIPWILFTIGMGVRQQWSHLNQKNSTSKRVKLGNEPCLIEFRPLSINRLQ